MRAHCALILLSRKGNPKQGTFLAPSFPNPDILLLYGINKYSGKILLWSAIFKRTPAVNEQLKKSGQDPAKIPETESLVQMMIGKTDKGWKIIRMSVQ